MFIVNIALFSIIFVFGIIVLFLMLQVINAVFYSEEKAEGNGARKPVAVLIPAHNEENIIGQTIEVILPQLVEGDRIIVVADNCSDITAEVAREAGAEVIIRTDANLRGKGYALDFGVNHLRGNPPEIIIIIDADCIIGEDTLERIARKVADKNRPVQALYLMHNPPNAFLKQKVAEFAFLVKNHIRPLGMKRMGLPCQLMGTGMGFPWEILSTADIANGNIVEDMKLGIDLMTEGHAPLFCPQAKVISFFPADESVVKGQRKRWEHGHLDTIMNYAPALFISGLRKFDFKLIFFAVDLAILPLALLSTLLVVLLIIAACAVMAGGHIYTLYSTLVIMFIFGVTIAIAWYQFGRKILSFSELLSIPSYILGKVPLYLGFPTNKQKDWVKTDRDDSAASGKEKPVNKNE